VILAMIAALSFVPLFSFFRKSRPKRAAAGAAAVLALLSAPVLYFVIVIAVYQVSIYYGSETFSQEAWAAAGPNMFSSDRVPSERYRFSADLIERKLLVGKTREQVIELLGDDYFESGKSRIGYDLGFVPGHGFDPDYLEITFEDGVVIKVEQHRS